MVSSLMTKQPTSSFSDVNSDEEPEEISRLRCFLTSDFFNLLNRNKNQELTSQLARLKTEITNLKDKSSQQQETMYSLQSRLAQGQGNLMQVSSRHRVAMELLQRVEGMDGMIHRKLVTTDKNKKLETQLSDLRQDTIKATERCQTEAELAKKKLHAIRLP